MLTGFRNKKRVKTRSTAKCNNTTNFLLQGRASLSLNFLRKVTGEARTHKYKILLRVEVFENLGTTITYRGSERQTINVNENDAGLPTTKYENIDFRGRKRIKLNRWQFVFLLTYSGGGWWPDLNIHDAFIMQSREIDAHTFHLSCVFFHPGNVTSADSFPN